MKNKNVLLMGLLVFSAVQNLSASGENFKGYYSERQRLKRPFCACFYKASYRLRTACKCRYSALDLYYAIQTEDYDRLARLLKKTDVQSPGVQRLIFQAISNYDVKALKLLLEAGVDVNYTDAKNQTSPLAHAVKNKPKTVGSLIGLTESDKNEVIRFLLAQPGVNVRQLDSDGYSALSYALHPRYKYFNTALILLEAGADANHNPLPNRSNLTEMVHYESVDVVRALLDKGADIDAVNYQGKKPLQMAVSQNSTKIVIELTKTARANGRRTQQAVLTSDQLHQLLSIAVSNNNIEIFRALLMAFVEMTVNYNYQDAEGNTMLHKAVKAYSAGFLGMRSVETLPMIEYLIRLGVNPNLKNAQGLTPMDLASSNEKTRTYLAKAAARCLVDGQSDRTQGGGSKEDSE